MKNPWLDIPLDDYEAHMALPYVGQAKLLSDVLAGAIQRHGPRSVAVLGCSGGNGLERIPTTAVRRVVGIDINPEYIDRTRVRFGGRIPLLELFTGDVQTDRFVFEPVELVFAGLIFEYVDVAKVMARIPSMLRPKGMLLTVLQLSSEATEEITPSPYAALGVLSSVLRLVPPERLLELAKKTGFRPLEPQIVDAAGEKRFHVQGFRLEAD